MKEFLTTRQQLILKALLQRVPANSGQYSLNLGGKKGFQEPYQASDGFSKTVEADLYPTVSFPINEKGLNCFALSSLPKESKHIFLTICDQPSTLAAEVISTLDLKSETTNQLGNGYFAALNDERFTRENIQGFFLIPITKWKPDFPTALHIHEDRVKVSLLVFLSQNELNFGKAHGIRPLYKRIRHHREGIFFLNRFSKESKTGFSAEDNHQNLTFETTKNSRSPKADSPNVESTIDGSGENPFQKQKKSPNRNTIQNSQSKQDFITKYRTLDEQTLSDFDQQRSSRTSAFERLRDDLADSEDFQEHRNSAKRNRSYNKRFSLWKIPAKIQIIGETIFGGLILTGGGIYTTLLIKSGQLHTAFLPAFVSIAGAVILRDALYAFKHG